MANSRFGSDLVGRLRWGLAWAVRAASWLTVIATIAWNPLGAFSYFQVSYWQVIVVYWVGCSLTGVLAGIVRPLAKTRPRALVLGIVVALPFSVLVGASLRHFQGWDSSDTDASCVTAIMGGAIISMMAYGRGDPPPFWGRRKRKA